MFLHTGRSGLCPSDLCLFNTDLSEILSYQLSAISSYGKIFLVRNPGLRFRASYRVAFI